jgi:hypothetical protein
MVYVEGVSSSESLPEFAVFYPAQNDGMVSVVLRVPVAVAPIAYTGIPLCQRYIRCQLNLMIHVEAVMDGF